MRYDGYVSHRARLAWVCLEKDIGARWSMAAIDDSISGVGNFERVAQTVQWATINMDRSRRGDRVNGGCCSIRVGQMCWPGSTVPLEDVVVETPALSRDQIDVFKS